MLESLVLNPSQKSRSNYTFTSGMYAKVFDKLNRFVPRAPRVFDKPHLNELPKVMVCFEVAREKNVISSLEGMSVSVTPTKREKHDEI